MKKIIYHTLFFICLASITACKGGIGGSAMTGEPGELLVIINDELKNAETGEKVLEILNEEDSGLTQSEPPFSTILC